MKSLKGNLGYKQNNYYLNDKWITNCLFIFRYSISHYYIPSKMYKLWVCLQSLGLKERFYLYITSFTPKVFEFANPEQN